MMRVLGIETTCDETAAAVVRLRPDGTGEILADEVMSQIAAHAPFGGVVPEIAARAHVEIIDLLIARALKRAQSRGQGSGRRGGRGRSGPDWRRARRPDGGQGRGVGVRQAFRRRQPPRGACADRAPDGEASPSRFSCSSPRAGIRRSSRSRASATTTGSARPWTTPSAKRSTRPPNCWGCPFPAGRRSRRRRKAAIPRDSRCPGLCSAGRTPIFRCPGSRRRCVWRRNPPRRCARATSPISAPRFRRRWSTWSRIAFASA